MAVIKIKCPTTGKELSTGMSMSKEVFERSRVILDTAGPCPHCGKMHVWEKKDAWVEV
jgi:endogenous inhibitor of DNA gyrase (YacG/DUF329 family)